jgi:hypothetical protein
MRRRILAAGAFLLAVPALLAQTPARKNADALTQAFRAQSSSSISYSGGKDGEQAVEITNVAYELSGDSVPGRPASSRLVLRTSIHSKQIVGDKGFDSTVVIEAWLLGTDLKQKPLYALTIPGAGAQLLDYGLWQVDRSLDPDVSWWSVYKLGTGERLFDTYVEPLRFTVSRADGSSRYAGLEAPPDDAEDARLKEPHVVAVLTYASAEKVIREALITCADTTRAQSLRSYADTMRTIALVEHPAGREIRITFEDAYLSPPHATIVSIPIARDDLDVAHAQLPSGLHAAVWRR